MSTRRGRPDGLTGLGDRHDLTGDGQDLLARSAGPDEVAVLLLIDVDSLKHLNDSAGHLVGDQVIRETARRLGGLAGPDDVLVRLGGDEFALLAIGPATDACRFGEECAEAVLAAFRPPVQVAELAIAVDVSVGLACHPEDGATVDELLRAADQAMYDAKDAGGGGWRPALRGPDDPVATRARLLEDLRSPSLGEQVVVHYQPQVHTGTGQVVGFEALARWQHPELGLLPARSFVPLAEQQQLLGPITEAVLEQALDALPRLGAAAPGSRLSLNVTRRHILDSGLLESIAERLRRRSLAPEQLLLEISSPVTRSGSAPQPVFDLLHELGIGVSIRGYGRTWSALTALWHNPAVREVKLHPLLVRSLPADAEGARLVRALVAGARELGLRVVAEGLEDPAGLTEVARLGCEVAQGLVVAEPADLGETLAWVDRYVRTS